MRPRTVLRTSRCERGAVCFVEVNLKTKSGGFEKRAFWLEENLRYTEPHYRLEKCARVVNALSRGKSCDLLDVGCGPAALARLLGENISYFGIDFAIHTAAPNLLELDIVQNEIGFGSRIFDVVVMQGVVEYLGNLQRGKFAEVHRILKGDGKFIVTYVNFGHRGRPMVPFYNNVQSIADLKNDLQSFFTIERWFPTSYNWRPREPRRGWLKKIQMHLSVRLPLISPMLAVEYIFICSRGHDRQN